MLKVSIMLALLVFHAFFASAQNGSISGTVSDEQTGETLIGVNVLISGTAQGTATDLDGNFAIRNLEPGIYQLSCSYISYTGKIIDGVVVEDGRTTVVDFSLSQASIEFEDAVVISATALDNTENALLNMRKKALGVEDGISAQEMNRFGTSDAASALSKVTGISAEEGKYIVVRGLGDRYSTTQLNGQQLASSNPYRNASSLDMIPANLLDNIITSKTFTPNLPGSFTGGNVNVKTKSFPDNFTLSFKLESSFNDQSSLKDGFLTMNGGSTDWLGYDDGSRAMPEVLQNEDVRNQLSAGFYIPARKDDDLASLLDEVSKGVSSQMAPSTKTSPFDHKVSFSMGNQGTLFGKPFGYLFGFNYGRTFSMYQNAVNGGWQLNQAGAQELNNTYLLNDNKGVENPVVGGIVNLASKLSDVDEISINILYNHSSDIISRYQRGSYPGILSNSQAELETRTLQFTERGLSTIQLSGKHAPSWLGGMRIEWTAGYSHTFQDEPDLRFFANTVVGDSLWYITASEYDLPFHFWRQLQDDLLQAKIDFELPFLADQSKANVIKFGASVSSKERQFDEYRFQLVQRDGVPYDGNPDAYFSPENTGIIGYDDDKQRYTFGNYLVDESRIQNFYSGHDRVMATYLMGVYDLQKKLKISGGLRIESTDLFAQSEDSSIASGDIRQVDLLPALNFTYALTEKANLRASVTQTLARPNMREISPFNSFDMIGGDIIRGNSELNRTLIQNVDLRWEYFPNAGELYAVSAYYKHFDQPIVEVYVPQAVNPERTWQNVQQAVVYGIEVELRKNLGMIGNILSNFSIGANASLIYSRVDIPNDEYQQNVLLNPDLKDWRPFQGQSPYLVNTNLVYDSDSIGLECALSYNVFGKRLSTVSLFGTPDIYEAARPTLDLKMSKRISRDRIVLSLGVSNILNSSYRQSIAYNSIDYAISDYTLGRTYTVGLSYLID